MNITAAVLHENAQPLSIEELVLDDPRPDEVLVRLVATGVCHTDLFARDHPMVPPPVVLGHEGAGIVERVGEYVSTVRPGDHVVLSYNACGQCDHCRQGEPAYCRQFLARNFSGARPDGSSPLHQGDTIIHGCFFGQSSFATHALAREQNVAVVRQDVPIEVLGPLGCGIQTGAGAVLNVLQARAGSSIAVFGTGPVGLSAVMAAHLAGCTTIIAIDLKPQRLALAQELGATHTVQADIQDPVQSIREATGGVTYSLETTGSPQVVRQAVDALQARGVCGLLGLAAPGTDISFDLLSIVSGRTIRGISEGDSIPQLFIPQLIDLYVQGRFPFDRLVAFYSLSQINEAMADMEQGRTIKPVLRMA